MSDHCIETKRNEQASTYIVFKNVLPLLPIVLENNIKSDFVAHRDKSTEIVHCAAVLPSHASN